MAWQLFWQLIVFMVLGTVLAIIIINVINPPQKKEDH
jgi:type IV secretory pathway component VirB8